MQIVQRIIARRASGETQAGDVHVCVSSAGRVYPIWMTQEAYDRAVSEGLTLADLDRLIGGGYVRSHSQEYPIRSYYLDLMRENIARLDAGEPVDSLWRWRTLRPSPRSEVSAICRWTGQRWVNRAGEMLR